MLNIFKIWFFTAVFLLSKRKYFKQFEKYDEEKKEKEIFELLREFDSYILNKINMEVEVINPENVAGDEAVLYVSNHPSMLDPLFLLKVVEFPISFFVAKSSKVILKIPYAKNFYKYMQNVYIDRNNIKSGVKSIKEGKERLRAGFNLAIFPEGQITKVISNHNVGEFKGGSFKTALDEKKSIIPITLIGAENIQKTPSIFSPIKSQKITIKVHPKIDYKTIQNFKTKELADYVKSIIKEGMEVG